ncbi:serine/threonine-protein kinase ULK3 isoform X2 [Hemicordylus capensis]|uniref:serine/threonine-protein kinase ULK3 isoform X2 n=1 Tax=Hemicordylus capensis TaxID=884348 RepID=UPI0023040453|nr:serine/threonine-protein kinase ULK3 isoform X2 [Hemicordylus capensis]
MHGGMAGAGWAPPQLEDFILTERLGSGTYATVFKGYRKRNVREVVAVKCVNKRSLNKASVENLLTEIEILKTIRHPHIVELKDFQWNKEYIYLIMEYCAGGDLSRFIHARRILPERVARIFLQQLACALKFLHDRNISHLDLKPQNILLSSLDKPYLKLAEALFGRPPFASKSFSELEEKIRSNQPIELPGRPRLSPECRDLLQCLLKRDPQQRISFKAFFAHPFVDMEHMPSEESLGKATNLVMEAVEKDQAGDASAALSLYSKALEYFVPALRYEIDARRKEAIRSKVSQYISRAEQLKVLVSSNNKTLLQQGNPARDILKEMSKDKPRLYAALAVASAAVAKEEEGKDDSETLDLYQQSLGELLLMLAAEPAGRRKELLHAEIQTLMGRAEYLKEQIKRKESQLEAESMGKEGMMDSVRGSCTLQ